MRGPAPLVAACLVLAATVAAPLLAQPPAEPPAEPPAAAAATAPEADWDPLFLGHESEPAMPSSGRVVASLQAAAAHAFAATFGGNPAAAPAWEFPTAAVLLLVQHEVSGHGGRGRELGLGPDYGFGFDLSAYTTLERAPRTNEHTAVVAAGGAEADGVMARRILLDALRPEGVDGARLPLALMAKLDLSMYVAGTTGPGDEDEDFADQYREGNDVAFYLVARQAQRVGADPTALWEGLYEPALGDPLLDDTWDDVRATALWNVLDPSLVAAVFGYFRQHVIGGDARVVAPVLPLGDEWGLTAGTRAALAPDHVTRFLDLYLVPRDGRGGVLSAYVRDLDSSVDRGWGGGAALHAARLGERVALSVQGDFWDAPESREDGSAESGWHAAGEVEVRLGARLGVAAKAGAKSDGFFPGVPLSDGAYGGFGVTVDW